MEGSIRNGESIIFVISTVTAENCPIFLCSVTLRGRGSRIFDLETCEKIF